MTHGKSIFGCLAALLLTGGAQAQPAAMPDVPARSACSVRVQRDALLADAGPRIAAAFDTGLARATRSRERSAERLQRLRARGGLSDEAAAALQQSLQQAVTASETGQREEAANAAFIAATEAFDDARARNRARQACLALVDVLTAIGQVVETTEARWASVDAGYEAEAARRGVSLDERL